MLQLISGHIVQYSYRFECIMLPNKPQSAQSEVSFSVDNCAVLTGNQLALFLKLQGHFQAMFFLSAKLRVLCTVKYLFPFVFNIMKGRSHI